MKQIATLFLLFTFGTARAQDVRPGIYKDALATTIVIKSDKSFYYSWRFDLSYSWSAGRWNQSGDTLFLITIPVLDTIRQSHSKAIRDSLILSIDSIANVFDKLPSVTHSLGGEVQGIRKVPEKLLLKRGRLYYFGVDGLPIDQPHVNPLTGHAADPWLDYVQTP